MIVIVSCSQTLHRANNDSCGPVERGMMLGSGICILILAKPLTSFVTLSNLFTFLASVSSSVK